jgi:hypothetical protein
MVMIIIHMNGQSKALFALLQPDVEEVRERKPKKLALWQRFFNHLELDATKGGCIKTLLKHECLYLERIRLRYSFRPVGNNTVE